MRPFLERIGTAVEDEVALWAGEIGVERDVEGKIDEMAGDGGVGIDRGAVEASFGSSGRWWRNGEILLKVLRPGHAKAHRRRHLLPAMPSLPSEVGDLVHHGGGTGWGRAIRMRARSSECGGEIKVRKAAR